MLFDQFTQQSQPSEHLTGNQQHKFDSSHPKRHSGSDYQRSISG